MKILWITNVPIPVICRAINLPISYGGGWLVGLSEDILKQKDKQLCIAFPIDAKSKMKSGIINNCRYYAVPCNKVSAKYSRELELKFYNIYKEFKPDIVHIWGTEYVHTYHAVKASENCGLLDKTIISIQGLVSIYADYYFANIPKRILSKHSFKELITKKNLKMEQKLFMERGKFEILALKKVKHVIGRTDWDRACTYFINPLLTYHFCNESLRNTFYNNTWSLEKCNRHSIFISQSQYPIKGLHIALDAVGIVKKYYPDVHIYTTGKNRMTNSKKDMLKFSTYDYYIRKLIEKYKLSKNVTFLGILKEEEMCRQYLNANVFVSASSIENSPNSVGEAMLLGVPTISSDVGGIKNMIVHSKEGYIYPFDHAYMLAYYICKIFRDDELAKSLSILSRKHANVTHSREKNVKQLCEIYKALNKQI